MQEEIRCLKERHQCDEAVIAALKLKLKGENPTIVGTKEMMDYVNYVLQDCEVIDWNYTLKTVRAKSDL